ncbi:zinc finger protein 346 [Ornithorhynchus anatinus]|uniref:Zinc finger protein 346 n=1 Tax=Ornithorhynchus anatinus TaxID=9258 RepID=F6PHD8_ORNAN|nr:zinc finger protein 346 [Ornithorhynchus anatinus]
MADGAGSNGDAVVVAVPVGKAAVDRMIQDKNHLFTSTQCKVCSALLISESQKLAHYQSKKHANKVRRYLSIHGEEEFTQGKRMKMDSSREGGRAEDRNKCCPVCNMTFSSPVVAQSHYLGKTHAKNLKLKQQQPQQQPPPHHTEARARLPTSPPSAPASTPSLEVSQDPSSDPDRFCRLCHATFNNPTVARQHYVGKKHKKQETKLRLLAHYGHSPDSPVASSAGKGYPCNTCHLVLNSIEQYLAHVSGFKHKNQTPGAGPAPGRFARQQYVQEEPTTPGGYSYFSQDF